MKEMEYQEFLEEVRNQIRIIFHRTIRTPEWN